MRMAPCTHFGLYVFTVSFEHHKEPLKLYYACFSHEDTKAKGSQRTGPHSQVIIKRVIQNIIKMILYRTVGSSGLILYNWKF